MPLGLTNNGMGLEGIMQIEELCPAPSEGGNQDSLQQSKKMGQHCQNFPCFQEKPNNNNPIFILPKNTPLPRNECAPKMTIIAYI